MFTLHQATLFRSWIRDDDEWMLMNSLISCHRFVQPGQVTAHSHKQRLAASLILDAQRIYLLTLDNYLLNILFDRLRKFSSLERRNCSNVQAAG